MVVEAAKRFPPVQVLLSARSVEEAVLSDAQEKLPPFQMSLFPPVQGVRPNPLMEVPERFVVDAFVAKKFVVVAEEPVAFTNVMFWKVEEALARRLGSETNPPAKMKLPAECVNSVLPLFLLIMR